MIAIKSSAEKFVKKLLKIFMKKMSPECGWPIGSRTGVT